MLPTFLDLKSVCKMIHLTILTNTLLLGLHILYLKRDITQFPRNAFANQIEVYCSKFFYGPLVVVFCDTKPPYKLHDFPPYYLIEEIEPLNELEQKCYPLPFGKKLPFKSNSFFVHRCQAMLPSARFNE
jgi:hypothetical protein